MIAVARQFRKEPTPSEALLWGMFRGRKFDRIKFPRKQPIGPFVVDFLALQYRLVVEVDGPIHQFQQLADCERQKLIEMLGLKVIRIPAHLVETDIQSVFSMIRSAISNIAITKHQNEDPSLPSPLVGEGARTKFGLGEGKRVR